MRLLWPNGGLVTQSCPALMNPIDCSLPGYSVYGILQARILEWVAISSYRGSSHPREWTWVSCIAGRFFTDCGMKEAHDPISSVQFTHSVVSDSATPWTTAHLASLSITNSRSLPKLMSIELVMPSNHLIFCRPLLLLPSIFPNISVFSNESAYCIKWPMDVGNLISGSSAFSFFFFFPPLCLFIFF